MSYDVLNIKIHKNNTNAKPAAQKDLEVFDRSNIPEIRQLFEKLTDIQKLCVHAGMPFVAGVRYRNDEDGEDGQFTISSFPDGRTPEAFRTSKESLDSAVSYRRISAHVSVNQEDMDRGASLGEITNKPKFENLRQLFNAVCIFIEIDEGVWNHVCIDVKSLEVIGLRMVDRPAWKKVLLEDIPSLIKNNSIEKGDLMRLVNGAMPAVNDYYI